MTFGSSSVVGVVLCCDSLNFSKYTCKLICPGEFCVFLSLISFLFPRQYAGLYHRCFALLSLACSLPGLGCSPIGCSASADLRLVGCCCCISTVRSSRVFYSSGKWVMKCRFQRFSYSFSVYYFVFVCRNCMFCSGYGYLWFSVVCTFKFLFTFFCRKKYETYY